MQPLESLPPRLREYLSSQLAPGEQIVWIGQPDVEKAAAANRSVIIWTKICAVLTVALGLFFLVVVPSLPTLLLLVAFIVAAYFMWRTTRGEKERFLHCASVVTNQRALSVNTWKSPKLTAFGPEKLTSLECTEEPDGSGSIIFYHVRYTAGAGDAKTEKSYPVGFFQIPAVREAEGRLKALALLKA